MKPTIVVLIPTKNRKVLLERALKSVFSQENEPEEIIVVNDGSDDDTKEFLINLQYDHKNLKIIQRKYSGGVNVARNEAIQHSSCEWVAFLDDDDEFIPQAVKIMKDKIFNLDKNKAVVYFNSKIYRDNGSFSGGFQFQNLKKKMEYYDPSYEETMTKWNLKGDCKQVIKRDIFLKKEYQFPETVNGFESYTMNLIARDKQGIRYFPQELTLIHQESALKDRLSINASRKKPWPLFLLHYRQIFQHWKFYITHPVTLFKKKIEMLKLFFRTTITL